MKGAEGPGRGGPRGWLRRGGQELAPDRRRPGGLGQPDPGGSRGARLAGCAGSAWGRVPSQPSSVAPSPLLTPPQPLSPHVSSTTSPPPDPSPLQKPSEHRWLQSAFEAPRAPPEGRRVRTWTGAGVAAAPSGEGACSQPEFAHHRHYHHPPTPQTSTSPSASQKLRRRSGPCDTHRELQTQAWGGGQWPKRPTSSPAGEPWGVRGQWGLHKALLWRGDSGHRVAFVPPLTLASVASRTDCKAPGRGAGYVPGWGRQLENLIASRAGSPRIILGRTAVLLRAQDGRTGLAQVGCCKKGPRRSSGQC